MHNPGFQDDYSLVTFSRLRYPLENYEESQLLGLPISLLYYSIMLSPYMIFLAILYTQLRVYPLSSLELSTSFLIISHILFYLLLLVSHRRLYLLTDHAYQSRKYLEARGFDSAYKIRHYILITGIYLFAFLPYFLIILFSNSRFISEQFNSFTYSLTIPLVLLLIFFPGFLFALDFINTSRSFNSHAHSSFTHAGIEIKGDRSRKKFRMFYSLDEISSFVLLRVPNTLDFKKENINPTPPEDFALLYILDTLGNAQICGYYIQGIQLIQDVYSFINNLYPGIKIEILNAEKSADLRSFMLVRGIKNLRYLLEIDFLTPFYYPNTVVPKKIDPSENYSNTFPLSSKNLSTTEFNSFTESLTFKSLRNRYKSNSEILESYCAPITTWVILAVLCVVILFFFDESYFGHIVNMIAFAALSALGLHTPPPKKWYLPGLQSVPSLFVITLVILIVIG